MVPSALLAQMQATLVAAVPGVSFAEGERELPAQVVPPNVVWVDRADEFEAAEKTVTNPRALFTEVAVVEAHLWADTRDDLRALQHAVIRAAYRAAYGSLELRDGAPVQPDHLTRGRKTVLTLAFASPVTDAPWVTVVPNAFVLTPGTTGDGVLEPGES